MFAGIPCSDDAVCTAVSLRDDVKQYLSELLPNFTKLFEEAERTGRCAAKRQENICACLVRQVCCKAAGNYLCLLVCPWTPVCTETVRVSCMGSKPKCPQVQVRDGASGAAGAGSAGAGAGGAPAAAAPRPRPPYMSRCGLSPW